jgi:hypothetical protein
LQLALVPELVEMISSSRLALLLQSDHPAWKRVLRKL